MTVSPTTKAAFRFGYGFREGQPVSAAPEALLGQVASGAAAQPNFATDSIQSRYELLLKQTKAVQAAKKAKGAERDELNKKFKALRRDVFTLALGDAHNRIGHSVMSPNGFYERLVYFWANHFAVQARGKYLVSLAPFHEAQAIRPNVGGRFRELFGAATTHPAMLVYLNQATSVGPNSPGGKKRDRGLNENLAREILELHTLGVNGGYTQTDVTEFAKLLTGLRFQRRDPRVTYDDRFAEPGVRTVLGAQYGAPGKTVGRVGIERALDAIAAHPAVAPHVCGKLVKHFISDEPVPALVEAMVGAWRRTDGDLMAVYRAMLEHPLAWERFGAKIKTPLEFIVSGLRAVGATDKSVAMPKKRRMNRYSLAALVQLNQAPWQPSGPDGFTDENEAWLTPQGLASRLEWAAAVGRKVEKELDPRRVMQVALADAARPDTRFVVEGAAERWEGIALVLASPEFNRR